jgi:retron-type reverse transcriptase
MGLLAWLRRLFARHVPDRRACEERSTAKTERGRPPWKVGKKRRPRPRLVATRQVKRRGWPHSAPKSATVEDYPYRFARPGQRGGWLNLGGDADAQRLAQLGLPLLNTPDDLARWLGVSVACLAWLAGRFDASHAATAKAASHYHRRWLPKRSGGERLIESPKPKLKAVQEQILRRILDHVAPHSAAHGFVIGRSILTNARPHLGRQVVVRLDLRNFYPSVGFNRVVAIFRALGFARETAIWLGRLTTAQVEPRQAALAGRSAVDLAPYVRRHLPQGAPTSPALANLSAYVLDLRLAGLARSFGASYSRYADDLTFSGDQRFVRSLALFLPLVRQILHAERFQSNAAKRTIVRANQRQRVTGVVVNSRPNVSRREYDRLKATLTNCVRRGPSTQNHEGHANFAAHLRGKIAHVQLLNPARGLKLLALYERVNWHR